ncbi:MAG: glycosyltransferase family 4 protein [Anaerolineales bacterium]
MKLGLVTGEFLPMQGGVGDYTHELARALAALGVEIHIITNQSSAITRSGQPSVTVHPIIKRWSFPALFHIRSLARSLNLQILNIQYQAAAYGLSAPIHFLPDVAGVKTIVTFHDLRIPYLFPKAGRLREAAVTHLARSASGVIVTDPADVAELRRRGGVTRLAQIPIGSNIAVQPPPDYDRAAWRARMEVMPGEFLLGYFGFLNQSKGGDTLIGALAALRSRKARVKLVLIGGRTGTSDPTNAAFEAEVEKMIARYDLEDRVIRTGFVDAPEVSAYLLTCDAVALPYRDGASFRRGSLMAALAHGCPVITTYPASPLPNPSAPSAGQGLQDGRNIRLIPPDSASAIVLAVTELLDAPELRTRMGQGARELAKQFEWGTIAARTLEFYRSI